MANEKKSEQLGMPFGTACTRLRKSVMFMLVQAAELDTCVRCKSKIQTESELTIEHKEPWYNQDPNLFWDLDNIAFSHAKCNRPHTRGARPRAKHGTLSRYQAKCRCDACRKAKSDYAKKRRK